MSSVFDFDVKGMRKLWDAMDQMAFEPACSNYPDIFFPEVGTPSVSWDVKWALDMCNECPLKQACANYAIENNETHGIWGGTFPRTRRAIRQKLRLE